MIFIKLFKNLKEKKKQEKKFVQEKIFLIDGASDVSEGIFFFIEVKFS